MGDIYSEPPLLPLQPDVDEKNTSLDPDELSSVQRE
jgi:hypothetical protein